MREQDAGNPPRAHKRQDGSASREFPQQAARCAPEQPPRTSGRTCQVLPWHVLPIPTEESYKVLAHALYTPTATFQYPGAALYGVDNIVQFWNGFLIGRLTAMAQSVIRRHNLEALKEGGGNGLSPLLLFQRVRIRRASRQHSCTATCAAGRALQRNDVHSLHIDIMWDPVKLQAFVQVSPAVRCVGDVFAVEPTSHNNRQTVARPIP